MREAHVMPDTNDKIQRKSKSPEARLLDALWPKLNKLSDAALEDLCAKTRRILTERKNGQA